MTSSVHKLIDNKMTSSVDKSIDNKMTSSVDKSVDKLVDKSLDNSVDKSVDKAVDKLNNSKLKLQQALNAPISMYNNNKKKSLYQNQMHNNPLECNDENINSECECMTCIVMKKMEVSSFIIKDDIANISSSMLLFDERLIKLEMLLGKKNNINNNKKIYEIESKLNIDIDEKIIKYQNYNYNNIITEIDNKISKNNLIMNEKIKNLNKDNSLINDKINNLKKDNSLMNDKINNLNKDNLIINDKINNLNKDNSLINDKINNLNKDNLIINDKINMTINQIEDIKKKIELYKPRVHDIISKNELITKKLDYQHTKLNDLCEYFTTFRLQQDKISENIINHSKKHIVYDSLEKLINMLLL